MLVTLKKIPHYGQYTLMENNSVQCNAEMDEILMD